MSNKLRKRKLEKSELKLCRQLCKIARVDSIILDLVSAASIILEFSQEKRLKKKCTSEFIIITNINLERKKRCPKILFALPGFSESIIPELAIVYPKSKMLYLEYERYRCSLGTLDLCHHLWLDKWKRTFELMVGMMKREKKTIISVHHCQDYSGIRLNNVWWKTLAPKTGLLPWVTSAMTASFTFVAELRSCFFAIDCQKKFKV